MEAPGVEPGCDGMNCAVELGISLLGRNLHNFVPTMQQVKQMKKKKKKTKKKKKKKTKTKQKKKKTKKKKKKKEIKREGDIGRHRATTKVSFVSTSAALH